MDLGMWPDEQDASSSSHSPSPAPDSPQAVLINGATIGEDGRVTPTNRILAYYPILLSRQLEQMQSDLHQDCSPSASSSISGAGSVMSSSRRSTEPATTLVAISNANLLHVAPSQIIDCSKCSLKEMEIRQLRKRVQALEEQLCRAIGTKKIKVHDPAVVSKPLPAVQFQNLRQVMSRPSAEVFTPTHHQPDNSNENTTEVHVPKVRLMENQAAAIGTGSRKSVVNADDTDSIELVPGTNVFISTARLQQILSIVKTGKQLARKLMSIYWDRMILARSTLSAASQHYEQLDPKIISAIKTYCTLFDGSARKSEIHSTMIDKCVQARRPRRSSLKQPEPQQIVRSNYQQETVNILMPNPPPYLVSQLSSNDRSTGATERPTGVMERPTGVIERPTGVIEGSSGVDNECTEVVHVTPSFITSQDQLETEIDENVSRVTTTTSATSP